MKQQQSSFLSLVSLPALLMGLLGFGSLLLVIMVGIPRGMEAWEMQTKIETAEKQLEAYNERINLLRSYESQGLRNKLEGPLLNALPTRFDIPYVIAVLNYLAQEQSLVFEEVSTTAGSSTEDGSNTAIAEQIVKLSTSGHIDSVERLLGRIDEMAPVMLVQTVDLSGSVQSPDIVGVNIEVVTFAYGAKEYDSQNIAAKEIPTINADDEVLYEELSRLEKLDVEPVTVVEGDTGRDLFNFTN